MPSPSFLSHGSTPQPTDTVNTLLKRIAGGLAAGGGGGGGAGEGFVYFYEGAAPPSFSPTDETSAAFAYSKDNSGPTFTWNPDTLAWQ